MNEHKNTLSPCQCCRAPIGSCTCKEIFQHLTNSKRRSGWYWWEHLPEGGAGTPHGPFQTKIEAMADSDAQEGSAV